MENGEKFYRFEVTSDIENVLNEETGEYEEQIKFTTAGIISKAIWGDGKIEVIARSKGGKSSWPALWMSTQSGGENYSSYYEIDLSEYYETRDMTDTTYHYPKSMRNEAQPKRAKTLINKIEDNITDWNKYTVLWNKNLIQVYINDELVLEQKNDGDATVFPVDNTNRLFRFIISMQYGGSRWLSNPDPTELPIYMDVKSFKYWQNSPGVDKDIITEYSNKYFDNVNSHNTSHPDYNPLGIIFQTNPIWAPYKDNMINYIKDTFTNKEIYHEVIDE